MRIELRSGEVKQVGRAHTTGNRVTSRYKDISLTRLKGDSIDRENFLDKIIKSAL